MVVSGEEAMEYDAISLSSLETINQGLLKEANTDTGVVKWLDKTGQEKTATLGERAICIRPKSGYGR